ncbi:MAG TPA: hypothetical protein VIF64_11175 [Pyrinomonadaceae bacterium]
MHTAKTAEAIHGDTNAFEIREFDTPVITNHHVFNVATAIDKRTDLPAGFV